MKKNQREGKEEEDHRNLNHKKCRCEEFLVEQREEKTTKTHPTMSKFQAQRSICQKQKSPLKKILRFFPDAQKNILKNTHDLNHQNKKLEQLQRNQPNPQRRTTEFKQIFFQKKKKLI